MNFKNLNEMNYAKPNLNYDSKQRFFQKTWERTLLDELAKLGQKTSFLFKIIKENDLEFLE